MTRPSLSRWPRLTHLPLALEIALALLLKTAILVALWYAFFSDPQAKHMLLPAPQVEQHLLEGAAAVAPASSAPSTLSAVTHSAHSAPSQFQPKAQHGSD